MRAPVGPTWATGAHYGMLLRKDIMSNTFNLNLYTPIWICVTCEEDRFSKFFFVFYKGVLHPPTPFSPRSTVDSCPSLHHGTPYRSTFKTPDTPLSPPPPHPLPLSPQGLTNSARAPHTSPDPSQHAAVCRSALLCLRVKRRPVTNGRFLSAPLSPGQSPRSVETPFMSL